MNEAIKEYSEKMEKTIGFLRGDFAAVRAGRANPAVLDKITVDYYGTPTPLTQMAAISVSEARVLVVQPWDGSALKNVEKAIQASDIGINPTNDGHVLRIVFPQLTEERRKELVKQIKKMGEDAKIALRAIRRDAIDKFKKEQKTSAMTEDDLKDIEADMQKLIDEKCKSVDSMMENKEKEIMEI